jgi:hypothetical protein
MSKVSDLVHRIIRDSEVIRTLYEDIDLITNGCSFNESDCMSYALRMQDDRARNNLIEFLEFHRST